MDDSVAGANGANSIRRLPRIAFVMEQHVGHRTYSENLFTAIHNRDDVEPMWVPINYASTNRWWERLPMAAIRAASRGRAEVAQGLRGSAPDVCVFNTQVPAVIGDRAARARPYVLCTDVTPVQYDAMAQGYSHRADGNGPVAHLKHRWNRHVLRAAAAHAPWSTWAGRSLVDDYGIDPARIEVIPPGVDTAGWRPREHSGDGLIKVLFVGGEFERKGGDLLLAAFADLPSGIAELALVTRDPITRRPGVRVYNHLSPNDPELLDLYQTSDVFVLPSRSETFGISAVEAGAAGLAIVASAVGGLGDLVIDGVTGLLTQPGSVDELTRHLRRLADDPDLRRRLGLAARQRAVAEFDATINADRLIRLALGCIRP